MPQQTYTLVIKTDIDQEDRDHVPQGTPYVVRSDGAVAQFAKAHRLTSLDFDWDHVMEDLLDADRYLHYQWVERGMQRPQAELFKALWDASLAQPFESVYGRQVVFDGTLYVGTHFDFPPSYSQMMEAIKGMTEEQCAEWLARLRAETNERVLALATLFKKAARLGKDAPEADTYFAIT